MRTASLGSRNLDPHFAASSAKATSPLQAWSRFWFSATDPSTLGLIRILTGLVVIYVHVTYTGPLFSFFGKDAWMSLDLINEYRHDQPHIAPPVVGWTQELEEAERNRDLKPEELQYFSRWNNTDPRYLHAKGQPIASIWFHVTDPKWMVAIHACFFVIMILFTIGFCTRVTSILTWLAALCYIQRSWPVLFGMDTITNLLLIYLMIGPSGAAFSVDSWLKRRRLAKEGGAVPLGVHPVPAPSIGANLALRCMQINFCIIYLASATSKLQGSTWWNGNALWGVTGNAEFNPLNVDLYLQFITFLAKNRYLWEICMTSGVIFTLFVELGFPFLVWNRRMRPFMIMGSVMLHVGIGLIMGLTTFSLAMLSMVLCFIPGVTTRWAINGSLDWLRGVTKADAERKVAASAA
jgi:hypothetical protein